MGSLGQNPTSNHQHPHQHRQGSGGRREKVPVGATASGGSGSSRSRINRALNRILHKPKSLVSVDSVDDGVGVGVGGHNHNGNNAASNPDLSRDAGHHFEGGSSSGGGGGGAVDPRQRHKSSPTEFPEHVLKVFRSDQTFKYLLVHKETTAREVVMLSLQEFGMAAGTTDGSASFSLCEVSVAEGGFVKQRRLPDALQNLAERIGLASRYYIKSVHSSEPLLPDEQAADVSKESQVCLLQLNPVELSTQLMVEDFTIFRQIEATEYIDDLFEVGTKSRFLKK